MPKREREPIDVGLIAVQETAGSALYGMLDVLAATGTLWEVLTRAEGGEPFFRVSIVSESLQAFRCGHGIPVQPDQALDTDYAPQIIIVPELWFGPDEPWAGRHGELLTWIRARYEAGAYLYSACSGSLMLAETGLLNGRTATSHWGYEDLFRQHYPAVRFQAESTLCFADESGRLATAGGTTSWHDLALHIISRHATPAQALRIAKLYLLKTHPEGQLPYAARVRGTAPHADAAVDRVQRQLQQHFRNPDALAAAISASGVPERSLKRRFRKATGLSMIECLQNLRIEAAKRLLEQGRTPIDEISHQVGYEDPSFFRRLFKRLAGLAPSQYRQMYAGFHE